MDPQEIVENIFNERQQPNVQHTATTATAIQLFINNAFKNKLLFIYELLQNADDSAQKGQNGYHIEVEIHFFKDYVLFQHNGAPFLAGDVWALSRLGHQIDEINPHPKSHDINKIGYKGVGFKSVFALKDCNCCYIKSGGFCFRFDKNFEEWKSIPYPWQVTPIWTNMEELPEEVLPYLAGNKTSIICVYLDYTNNYSLSDIVKIVEPLQYIIQGELLPIETVPLELISDKSDRNSPRVD